MFSKTLNNFPQKFPLDTQDAVLKFFSHFYGKEVENFGSKSGTDEKKFFPIKLICGHKTCSFEKCREPFNESPKTFRPKSQKDKHMCGLFRKKFPSKEYSAYVESTFNNFPIIFRTKISKLFAQTFQQNFSLDSVMQFETGLSDVFWNYGRFFLLQSRNSITKLWVAKKIDIFSQNKTLDTQDSVLRSPPQNFQEMWNWLEIFSQ